MTDRKQDKKNKNDPDLADVESGSDADTTPASEAGNTPPNPNDKK